jgi:Domain of unknown function (DUF6429)
VSTPTESTVRINETVLGLLYLTLHDRNRAWKGFDFAIFDRLHDVGLICDPVGKAKSVAFTDEGLKAAKAEWRKLFTSD